MGKKRKYGVFWHAYGVMEIETQNEEDAEATFRDCTNEELIDSMAECDVTEVQDYDDAEHIIRFCTRAGRRGSSDDRDVSEVGVSGAST
jgi:hypothetical protein